MKEANPKLIGIFLIGGIVLVVVALVMFSSQDFFTPKRTFVAYFQQSVNGLNVGAPVKFRGIPVGEVLMIEGVYDPDYGSVIPRVTIEFLPETLTGAKVEKGEYTLLPFLLANGLRASLKSQSILTGQLYVALNFHPDTPERRLGGGEDNYPELPTLDSSFDEALAKLQDLPIEEVLARAGDALAAAEDLLRNPDIIEALAALPRLLTDTNAAILDLQTFVSGNLTTVANDASETLVSARGLTSKLTNETLVQTSQDLTDLDSLLRQISQRLDRGDPLMHELLATLREFGSAARALRDLANELEEHPESLIRGKTRNE